MLAAVLHILGLLTRMVINLQIWMVSTLKKSTFGNCVAHKLHLIVVLNVLVLV